MTMYVDGRFWKSGIERGYPGTAKAVMHQVLEGKNISKTGRMSFQEGSFANGGIMRISPIAIAYRNVGDDLLYEAVTLAIISSHVHPEAIDGSWLQAKAITMLMKMNVNDMHPIDFAKQLLSLSRNEKMQQNLTILIELAKENLDIDPIIVVKKIW